MAAAKGNKNVWEKRFHRKKQCQGERLAYIKGWNCYSWYKCVVLVLIIILNISQQLRNSQCREFEDSGAAVRRRSSSSCDQPRCSWGSLRAAKNFRRCINPLSSNLMILPANAWTRCHQAWSDRQLALERTARQLDRFAARLIWPPASAWAHCLRAWPVCGTWNTCSCASPGSWRGTHHHTHCDGRAKG